jgi:hypothetical protein
MAPIGTHDWWPDAPWHERIDGRPVDVERTARFAGEGLRVRCSPTTPLDLCGSKPTPVYLSKKVSPWWKPLPAIRVPLPPVVHMNLRNPDCQVFFLDEEAGLYYELSAFRATPWFQPVPVGVRLGVRVGPEPAVGGPAGRHVGIRHPGRSARAERRPARGR